MIRLIEVTQDDIDNGKPGECNSCAIALALRREYKTDRVDVGIDDYSLPYLMVNTNPFEVKTKWKDLNINSFMESDVLDFIDCFDNQNNMYYPIPKPFTLEVVEWYKIK